MATEEDSALITAHRKAMFADGQYATDDVLDEMSRHFEPWVRRMIAEGKYLGWIMEDGARVAASTGMLLLDWPPHFLDPAAEQRAYLLNVFVEPDYRRRGLATRLVRLAMEEARRRKIRVVSLHASNAGRPVYEGLGFTTTSEMMHVEAM